LERRRSVRYAARYEFHRLITKAATLHVRHAAHGCHHHTAGRVRLCAKEDRTGFCFERDTCYCEGYLVATPV